VRTHTRIVFIYEKEVKGKGISVEKYARRGLTIRWQHRGIESMAMLAEVEMGGKSKWKVTVLEANLR
jgi:hypothetical protein